MKVLSNQNLEKMLGGILCSQLDDVIRYLLANNQQNQALVIISMYSVFGHGGTYTLQCQPG
jgi:hypothetical protein